MNSISLKWFFRKIDIVYFILHSQCKYLIYSLSDSDESPKARDEHRGRKRKTVHAGAEDEVPDSAAAAPSRAAASGSSSAAAAAAAAGGSAKPSAKRRKKGVGAESDGEVEGKKARGKGKAKAKAKSRTKTKTPPEFDSPTALPASARLDFGHLAQTPLKERAAKSSRGAKQAREAESQRIADVEFNELYKDKVVFQGPIPVKYIV